LPLWQALMDILFCKNPISFSFLATIIFSHGFMVIINTLKGLRQWMLAIYLACSQISYVFTFYHS
jgi:hypothetical protein